VAFIHSLVKGHFFPLSIITSAVEAQSLGRSPEERVPISRGHTVELDYQVPGCQSRSRVALRSTRAGRQILRQHGLPPSQTYGSVVLSYSIKNLTVAVLK